MKEEITMKDNKKIVAIADVVTALFYLAIIAVGVNLCLERGRNASYAHLVCVAVSVVAVLAMKIIKFKKTPGSKAGELIFPALLAAASVFALIFCAI